MLTKLPDDQGWYWCKILDSEEWCMAFVDTGREQVKIWDADGLTGPATSEWDEDAIRAKFGEIEWYGPITCPGGDFGGPTVVIDEEAHKKAAAEKSVIVLQHFVYAYCDDRPGSTYTIWGCYEPGVADAMLRKNAVEAGKVDDGS